MGICGLPPLRKKKAQGWDTRRPEWRWSPDRLSCGRLARTHPFRVEFAVMVKPIARPHPATAAVIQDAIQPRFGEVRIRQRGRLPHW